jgi:hypothetical protein
LQTAVLLFVVFMTVAPSGASAYSYGAPDQDSIAETFKLVLSKLDASDWDAALAAHKARRSEIASHFGEKVALTLDQNFESKNAADVTANYKAMLVMNLNRRFEYAVNQIGEYAQASLLLAKGRATFNALKPYMSGALPDKTIADLETRFDTALKAIGNPGLFGVGKAEADPVLLKSNLDTIYSTVEPLFPFTGDKGDAPPPITDETIGADGSPQTPPQGHAAMAQTNRTNPVITISVIAAVLIIGGGAVWWARRKGIF